MDKTSLLYDMFEQGIDPVEYFRTASEEMKMIAIENFDGALIKYMINPSDELKLAAINKTKNAISHIEEPTEEMILLGIRKYGLKTFRQFI